MKQCHRRRRRFRTMMMTIGIDRIRVITVLCTNHRLKWKKKEQRFILSRLELFDRQFCLDQIRDLYQIYFDQGLKYQIWSVCF